MAATSSFTEGASVFGGSSNLVTAIQTIFQVYDPDVIAVHTTCLSETIGDDIPSIIRKAQDEGHVPDGKLVFHTNTPSYIGSHVTGFSNMVRSMVTYFAQSSGEKRNQFNIIPGFVNPSDMRQIKSMAADMGVKTVLFPDTSDVLDLPMTGTYEFYPRGGITIDEIRTTGDSIATLSLGSFASEDAGVTLETKCGVPCEVLDLPIGISATDRFIQTLKDVSGAQIPLSIRDDRGRLLDMMSDMHQYFYGKKVAVFGDPDHIIPLVELLLDLNMKPVHVLTGTPGLRFERRVKALLDPTVPEANIKAHSDLFELHQWIKNEPVDLLIGNTYGKYIARAEDIPFVRYGFPILDRVGHTYFPTVGYRGGLHLVEKIVSTLLDRKDRDAADERFELVL